MAFKNSRISIVQSRLNWITAITVVAVMIVLVAAFTSENGFSVGLNIVRTLAALGTFVIALYLYDRFGLNKDIKSRQMSSVLALVEAMREPVIIAQSAGRGYFLTFRSDLVDHLSGSSYYDIDKDKFVYTDYADMEAALHPVLSFRNDLMIPEEIKNRLDDLSFVSLANISKDASGDMVLLLFDESQQKAVSRVGIPVPKTTLKGYCLKLEQLVQAVDRWIADHSEVLVNIER